MSLNDVFQPPNILSVPPNRLPPNKIPQPPNKKFILFWGSFQNSIRLWMCYVAQTLICALRIAQKLGLA